MRNILSVGFLFFLISLSTSCSRPERKLDAPTIAVEDLRRAAEMYREKAFPVRRFSHADMIPHIHKRSNLFSQEILGQSIEGRDIFRLDFGQGTKKVMLWSQMHGNESTATMALFDLFNFLEGADDGFEEIRNTLAENLHIRFIPMVNPDGAERFVRRNAWEIDLNRDFLHGTSPEAVILKQARDNFEPRFGFNLHDQNTYYTAKGSRNPATISVLAPAYDEATSINDVRSNAMKVIVGMNEILQKEVPGHVGKYNDAFEPRAFGDNFQKRGTSTILIESGGYPNDPEKQYIRRLNFMIILNALYQIATEGFTDYTVEAYFAIPDNESRLMDLLIKGVALNDSVNYRVDLGIRRREVEVADPLDYYVSGSIADLGDLSVFYGYEEIDESGLVIVPGKTYEQPINFDSFTPDDAVELLRSGYLAATTAESFSGALHNLPIIVLSGKKEIPFGTAIGSPTNFFLQKEDILKFAVINGYLIDLAIPEAIRWKQKVL
ncbi:M14 family zinc carboxypeptidase [Lunatibacter salilacus]|uniref:M14 family zinc carboxypeptidase n=1 Tax=Lunatibacter salilacus TaxID=2483804 RepID=UPI00131AA189|nr:M14 family zinc carboxypeptidase [Lunatibacter salilacus]